MITVTVDNASCQNYGHCCFEAEDVFQLDENGQLTYQTEVGDERLDAIEQAADACPMQAISLMQ